MNKINFSPTTYYRFIKIGIFLFLVSPFSTLLAMFFQGPAYQWPFRIFFILLSLIGLVLGFILFWYLLIASIFLYGKKDLKKAKVHLFHFLALAILPLLPIFVIGTIDFIQSGFQSPFLSGLDLSSLYYPAGGEIYSEFLPLIFEHCKNILSDPTYTIPYD